MADEIWLDVLPAMGGFGATLVKGTAKAAKDAGQKSGKEYSGAFQDGAGGAADAAVKELETAQARASGLVKKLSGDVTKAREGQQRSAADLLTAEQKLTDTVAKYGAESNQAEAATLRLEVARSKAKTATSQFETSEEALKSAQKSHKTVTDQLTTAQNELGNEVKEAPGLWGKLTGALGTAGDKIKGFSEGVGGTITKMAGAVGGIALLTDAFSNSMETETVVDKLNASLASTPAQAETYGAAAGNLYANAYGESMADVGTAVDAVVSSMAGMRDASQADIEKITANAMDLAAAFDVDVAEAAATAGSLMKNGLAADGVAAMDLIAGAMTKVPAAARGEILPIMDEYGKHFAALGIDGETAMGIIVASSADGAIGMDKMGDALKEFTIRGTDMSKSTVGAYEAMGLSAKDMTNDLLAGGDTAEGAMAKIVHGLQGIKDPGEQAAAAISLFGTPLEDLGTDQIPAFLGMVDPMGDAFDSTAGAADALGNTLNDNTATSLEVLKRSFQGMIADGVAPALGPLKSVMDWAASTPGVMQAVGIALGIVAVAWAAVTLAASPWLALGVGIALVIGGVILVVRNWGSIIGWLKTNVLEPFLNWIRPAWEAVGRGFDAVYKNVLKPVFDGVGAAASWLWKNVLQPVFKWMGEAWANWSGHAKTIWNTVLKPVFDAVGAAAKWLYDNTLKPVFGWISDRWSGMTSGVKSGWDKTMKPAWDAVSAGATWLYEKGIKPALGWISDKWTSLTKGIGTMWDKYGKPTFNAIADLLKGDFVGAWENAKTAVGNVWKGIANVVRKPINFVINTVYNDGIKKVFDKVAGIVGIKPMPRATAIPAFAKGGQMAKGWKLVGEEGPELINTGPGFVHTAKETQQMLAGKTQMPTAALGQVNPVQAHAGIGGFWSNIGDGLKGAASGIAGTVKGVWDKGIDWVRGGLANAAALVINPIKDGLRGALGSAGFGGMISGTASKLLDGAVSWLRGKDAEAPKEGSFGGGYDGPLGRFFRPAGGSITSGFGTSRGRYPHAGIDFAVPIGSAVKAMFDGVIQKIGWNAVSGRSGKGLVMGHGNGMSSYYGHLSNWVAQPGQKVKAGETIARSGNTGRSTGPHLHAELWRNGNPFNYASYLYDQGGVLEPGFTPVLNKTRQPEYVFTTPQWSLLERMVNRQITDDQGGTYNITISVKDLQGIKTLEEFLAMARRKKRQNVGS